MNTILPDFTFLLLPQPHSSRCASSYRGSLVGAPVEFPNLIFSTQFSFFMLVFACLQGWILLQSFKTETGFFAGITDLFPNGHGDFTALFNPGLMWRLVNGYLRCSFYAPH
jgi:hypothetical protein